MNASNTKTIMVNDSKAEEERQEREARLTREVIEWHALAKRLACALNDCDEYATHDNACAYWNKERCDCLYHEVDLSVAESLAAARSKGLITT